MTVEEILSLVRFRCGVLAPGDDTYDEAQAEVEVNLAARAVVERVPTAALLTPQEGTTGLSTLLAVADLTTLPLRVIDGDDDAQPSGLRGRVVVGLPADLLRLVRVRAHTWTRYLAGSRLTPTLDEPYPAQAYGYPVPDAASIASPDAYLTAFSFAAVDFPSTPPTDTPTGRLRPALVLAPTPDEDTLTGAGAARYLSEMLYLPVPTAAALPDGIADVVAWETAARLLQQDPETAGLATYAAAQVERVIDTLRPRGAVIASRVGILI